MSHSHIAGNQWLSIEPEGPAAKAVLPIFTQFYPNKNKRFTAAKTLTPGGSQLPINNQISLL
jgi:hypothetical protein